MKTKYKFLIFIGAAFFLYLVLFFPDKDSEVSLGKIGIDTFASILMAFVIVYVSDWFRKWIDSRFVGRR